MVDNKMIDFTSWWKPWQKELAEKHGITCDAGWYGFSCGEGWKDLLDRCFARMRKAGWNGKIHQVKEKFGTLRLYCEGGGKDVIAAIINEAVDESARTCEDCGALGHSRPSGWIVTLCDPCWKLQQERRKKLDTRP